MAEPVLRVLHVTASDQRRGAEVFAADLVAAAGGVEHYLTHLRSTAGPAVTFPCPTEPLRAQAGAAGLPGAARALRMVADRVRPGVVQVHGGEPLRLAVLAGLAGLGRYPPIVYRRIGTAPASMLSGWRRQWHRRLMGRATTVVCVAEAVRIEAVEHLGLDPRRAITIPNAVDPVRVVARDPARDRAALRAELGLDHGATVVLSLGALSWEKDPLGALDVTAPLLRDRVGCCHVFAGDGPLRAILTARAADLGVADRVVLAGSREDVGRVLAASDVVLFASPAGAMEGLPAVVIEAGLAGRPVVAADVAGVGEAVVNGETGVLVAAGDQHGLRAGVALLLDDPDRRDALGRAGARRCGERFTIEVVAPRYREVWDRAAVR